MSKIEVNTIDAVSGTSTLTLGSSNASTITKASGVNANFAGVKVAGMWRINANQNISADTETVINANWEEVDTDSYTRIGGAMSQSSGTWTFPETGIYQINWNVQFRDPSQGATRCTSIITVTTDNSNYSTAADNSGNIYHANGRSSVLSSHIFDVTDTSTHKCRLSALCEFAAACHAATGQSRTWVQFIRLGDT
jgi:hypothetical protein